jgi:TonB family protein
MAMLFYSCTDRGSSNLKSPDHWPVIAEKVPLATGDVVVCDFDAVTDTFDLPLSLLVSEVEIIRLDNRDDALVKAERTFVSENHVGVFTTGISGGYKLFDKSGQYLTEISSRGQGPDQYAMSVYDSYIDEQANRIYLLPMQGHKILSFDLQGNPQEHIPLAYDATKSKFLIDHNKQEVLVMLMPFSSEQAIVWTQDFQGNVIRELKADHLAIARPDYANEIGNSQNGHLDFSLYLWTPEYDSLYYYHAENNQLQPVFTFRSQKEPRQHEYIDLPNHYMLRMTDPAWKHYPLILIDKSTLKGSYVNLTIDVLGNIPGPAWVDFNRGYYIANMYAYELKQQLEQALGKEAGLAPETLEQMNELYENITDEDNNIIIAGKLKTDKNAQAATVKAPPQPSVRAADSPKTGSRPAADEALPQTSDDNYIYLFEDMLQEKLGDTPKWPDAVAYIKNNNRFGDWDKNDPKEVWVDYVVEKDGSTSNVTIWKSCGIAELDNEAVRLIKEAKIPQPGVDKNGKPVRCGDQKMDVHFPPSD